MKKIKRLLIIIALTISFGYLILFIFQRKFLYFPTKVNQNIVERIKQKYKNAEKFLNVEKNIKIHSWFIDKKSENTIIYFGGNAEDVNYTLLNFLDKTNYNIATMSYRSYGLSEGSVSEKSIYKDVLFFYDYLLDAEKIKNPIIIGRSLGTGIATYLASKRNIKKVILISPYDSIENIAKEQFPFAPITLLLKDKFLAENYAKTINKPMLAIYSKADRVVTQSHSKALIKSWKGKVKVIEEKSHNHGSLLFGNENLLKQIDEFIMNE